MKTTAIMTLLVAATCASLAGQEQKPVPKDSVRISIPGCSNGYVFTAARRTADQPGSTDDDEYLNELKPILGSDFGLDIAVLLTLGTSLTRRGGKSASGYVLLHQSIFLVPPVTQPELKLLTIIEGNVRYPKTTPVKIDGLGRATLEVCAG